MTTGLHTGACAWVLCALSCGATPATNRADAGASGAQDGGSIDAGPPDPLGLWVDGTFAFSSDQLSVSGSPTPVDSCLSTQGSGAEAFDSEGNLWVQNPYVPEPGTVVEWTAAQLATGACRTGEPAVSVNYGVPSASAMAFDSRGTLWLSTGSTGTILGLSRDQLQQSAMLNPWYTIGPAPQQLGTSVLHAPNGIAFDAAGNMWVGNWFSVLEYTPDQLASFLSASTADLSYAPHATLTNNAALALGAVALGPDNYNGLSYASVAFDAQGSLWVTLTSTPDAAGTVESTNLIQSFSPAQLGELGTTPAPSPVVTIQESVGQIGAAATFEAIAFDNGGALWLGTRGWTPNLFRYPASALGAGTRAPDVAITCPATDCGFSLAFDPIPAGLPISQ